MKNRMRGAAAAAACAVLASCAQNYPQNAQEFRQAAPGAFMGTKHSFEANRSVREIGKTFEARAPECLNVRVRTVSQTSTSSQNIVARYKATVVATADKAELHLQRHFESGVLVPGKEPPGGLYILVADAVPVGKGKTRIDIYGPSKGADVLFRAINGWASGDNLGCPDMTKSL
jgi:hypothetical protein